MTLFIIFQVLIRVQLHFGISKFLLVLGNPWIIKEDLESESEIASVLAISFLKIEVSNSSFIFRSTMKAFIYFSRRSQQDRAARRVVWLTTAAPPC